MLFARNHPTTVETLPCAFRIRAPVRSSAGRHRKGYTLNLAVRRHFKAFVSLMPIRTHRYLSYSALSVFPPRQVAPLAASLRLFQAAIQGIQLPCHYLSTMEKPTRKTRIQSTPWTLNIEANYLAVAGTPASLIRE